MLFSILKHLRLDPAPKQDAAVTRDADELILLWGSGAYDRATYLSWEEDVGLVSLRRPGHWWSVRREVGRRMGEQVDDPKAEFAF